MCQSRAISSGQSLRAARARVAATVAGRLFTMLAIGVGVVGCVHSDPRFEKRQAARDQRIERTLHDAHEREMEGGARIAKTVRFVGEREEYHADHLDKTARYIDQAAERERRLWPSRLRYTQDVIQDELSGDLSNIDQTIPYLFY